MHRSSIRAEMGLGAGVLTAILFTVSGKAWLGG